MIDHAEHGQNCTKRSEQVDLKGKELSQPGAFKFPNHSDFCYGKEKKTLGYPQLSDSLVIKHGAETSLYSRCKSLTKQ